MNIKLRAMKYLLLLFVFSCAIARAQNEVAYKELIVRVPELSERKMNIISKQLSCLDGLQCLGYFKDGSCLLLHIDSKKITDTEIITTIIHHLNEKMKTDVIGGLSIYELLDHKLSETKID